LLEFKQFKRNTALSDSLFKFVAPKGVDVVDNTSSSAATGGKGK
jgi:outer membrane lipoprotein-sorting protein